MLRSTGAPQMQQGSPARTRAATRLRTRSRMTLVANGIGSSYWVSGLAGAWRGRRPDRAARCSSSASSCRRWFSAASPATRYASPLGRGSREPRPVPLALQPGRWSEDPAARPGHTQRRLVRRDHARNVAIVRFRRGPRVCRVGERDTQPEVPALRRAPRGPRMRRARGRVFVRGHPRRPDLNTLRLRFRTEHTSDRGSLPRECAPRTSPR